MELDRLLEKLTQKTCIGYMGEVQDIIIKEITPYCSNTELGKDKSVYGLVKGGNGKNIMLACHVDEVGFMVSRIAPNGFIGFSEVGGVDVRILPGQEVIVFGRRKLRGYIGAKPPHLMTKAERGKVLPLEKLFVDTGLGYKELTEIVKIGDYISFSGGYDKLADDKRSAKSLDNRASVAGGILVLETLQSVEHSFNLHFVATSQEEFTGLGARTFSYKLPIDCAIVVDVTHAEYPDLKDYEYFPLNKGPVIAKGATIPEKLHITLIETAKELEIPYQIEALPTYTGTDADAIAFNREGIPTCVVSIPLRYMHTPVEVVSLKDIERTARLLVNFMKKI